MVSIENSSFFDEFNEFFNQEPMKSTAEALNGESPRIQVVTAETGKTKSSKDNKENICLTPGCVHAASKMLEQMDQDVEPCDDFYSFACGQFVEETIIPDDKVSVNAFSVISDKLQEQLRTIITAPVEESEIEPFKMVKKLYQACMNKSKFQAGNLVELFVNIFSFPSFNRRTRLETTRGHPQLHGGMASG